MSEQFPKPDFPQSHQAPGSEPVEPKGGLSPVMKGCLIGAGAVVALLIVIFLVGSWVFQKHSGTILAWSLERAKPEIMSLLSPDHKLEERREFSQVYDQMLSEIRATKMEEFGRKHHKSFAFYQEMILDRKITREESQKWIELWREEEGKKPSGN